MTPTKIKTMNPTSRLRANLKVSSPE